MLKTTYLLLICTLLLGACGGGAEEPASTTESAATPAASEESPTAPASTEPKADEPAKSDLSPESLKPDEAVDAGDLNNAVAANAEAWTGKEVTITGKNDGQSVSQVRTGQVVNISIGQTVGGKHVADCRGTEDPGKEGLNATKFKGTVKEHSYGRVILEPCSVVE